MINEEWTVLSEEETRKFLHEVRDEAFASLFDGQEYELWALELPFFEGYYRYRLNNCAILPHFALDYISNGENHFYLDGSDLPVRLLMMRGCVRLTQNNVLDYLDFFDDIVFDPIAKLKFIVTAHDTGYSGASAMEHHFKAIGYTDQRSIEVHDDHFLITIPALYNSKTVQARVRVGKDGDIKILTPVEISLIREKADNANPLNYAHPHEKLLLEENAELLSLSVHGKRLWDTIEHYNGDIRIISGVVGLAAFCPNRELGFIKAPAKVRAASPYQAISLCGALRDIELQLLGETRGVPVRVGPDEVNIYAEHNCARNLDIWLETCRMVDEIDASGSYRMVEVFKQAGFSALYTAYKNGADMNDLSILAAQMMNLEIRIEE